MPPQRGHIASAPSPENGRFVCIAIVLDAQKCRWDWTIVGGGCGICISACPYSKPKTWNHDLVRLVTRVPGLNSLARYFDELFGCGVPKGERMTKFWKQTI